jgi:hypothetical protein
VLWIVERVSSRGLLLVLAVPLLFAVPLLSAAPLLLVMSLVPEVLLVPAAPEVVPAVAVILLGKDATLFAPVVEEGMFLPLCCRPEWVVWAMLFAMCVPVLVLSAVVCVVVAAAVVAAAAVVVLVVLGFALLVLALLVLVPLFAPVVPG